MLSWLFPALRTHADVGRWHAALGAGGSVRQQHADDSQAEDQRASQHGALRDSERHTCP